MSSDDHALQLLVAGDVDSAINQLSRQGASPWVSGCVKAGAGKFVDAALAFFSGDHALEGVATALMEPWSFFPRFKAAQDLPSDLQAAVDAVLEERLLDSSHASAIARYLPKEVVTLAKVPQRAAEYNVVLVSRVAESIRLVTLQQYVDQAGATVAAEQLLCDMIERGATCRIDQVDGVVSFERSTQAARQSSHLLGLFNKVEALV